MRVVFSEISFRQYVTWQEEDRKIARKINALIKDCQRTPFEGLGKPEPLKHDWAGWWSRRIDREHRLVYRVSGSGDAQTLEIAQRAAQALSSCGRDEGLSHVKRRNAGNSRRISRFAVADETAM